MFNYPKVTFALHSSESDEGCVKHSLTIPVSPKMTYTIYALVSEIFVFYFQV